MAYSRDTEVDLVGTFKDKDGNLADPDEVTLEVLSPAGAVTSYTLSAAEVTRESIGVYTRPQLLDQNGAWYYRFKGTGPLKAARWKRIDVSGDPFS
jgi:hypothetical protein